MANRLPEIPLIPDPLTPEAKRAVGFEWSEPEVGRRHKLGGEPDWLQEPEVPTCEDCGEPTTFYGQLDSIGDDFALADAGMVYVFVCLGCFTTQAVLQSS